MLSQVSQVPGGWKGQWPKANALNVKRAAVQKKTKVTLKSGEENSKKGIQESIYTHSLVCLFDNSFTEQILMRDSCKLGTVVGTRVHKNTKNGIPALTGLTAW